MYYLLSSKKDKNVLGLKKDGASVGLKANTPLFINKADATIDFIHLVKRFEVDYEEVSDIKKQQLESNILIGEQTNKNNTKLIAIDTDNVVDDDDIDVIADDDDIDVIVDDDDIDVIIDVDDVDEVDEVDEKQELKQTKPKSKPKSSIAKKTNGGK